MSQAMNGFKSELQRVNGGLATAMAQVLGGNCVYIEHFLCGSSDFSILKRLKDELTAHAISQGDGSGDGMVSWSKHMKHEDPSFSPTFQSIAATLAAYFDVEVFASRLNYYRDGTDWKCFHKDSHAYAGANRAVKEDFTIGVSLGATRALTFLHEESDTKFGFPQKNGDVFAFSSEVNEAFMHGVPKASANVGERFSVICWGKRRTLNPRNSGCGASSSTATDPQRVGSEERDLVERVSRAMVIGIGSGPAFKEKDPTDAIHVAPAAKAEGKKPRKRLQ